MTTTVVQRTSTRLNPKPIAVYSGDTFRNLMRSYGVERMSRDSHYRRDVRAALKKKREDKAKREQLLQAANAMSSTMPVISGFVKMAIEGEKASENYPRNKRRNRRRRNRNRNNEVK